MQESWFSSKVKLLKSVQVIVYGYGPVKFLLVINKLATLLLLMHHI